MKTFGRGFEDRLAVEVAVLDAFSSALPVPRLLSSQADPASMRLAYVPGILGQEWVASTVADRVTRHVTLMKQCGSFLRRLHDLGRGSLEGKLRGDGPVVTHGDFAPYNLILGPDHGELRAVLDWELARFGSDVVDLAWMEWNMRIWYSPQPGVLEALYRSYGRLPDWDERHSLMLQKSRQHLSRALSPSYPSTEARAQWVEYVARTEGFEETIRW